MSYIKHNAIIVTGMEYDSDKLHRALEKARALFGCGGVSDIVHSSWNGFMSFFIAPDGSKEDWEESEQGDDNRKQLADFIDSLAYGDGSSSIQFVDVGYDEYFDVSVERTNKPRPQEDEEDE